VKFASARVPPWAAPLSWAWAPLLVLAAWLPSLGASFQFDDWTVIVQDAHVQSLGAWWDSMPGIRPLLKLAYALNHAFGSGVVGFRLVNVLLHAANAVLVNALLQRLLRRWRIGDAASATWIAAAATLVFALHPVQTESVTYLSARSNTQMATFALLALWFHTNEKLRPFMRQALVVGCQLGALATKETAAILPLVLWLAGACTTADSASRRPAWREALPAAITVVLALLAAFLFLPYDDFIATSLAERGPLANLGVQVAALPWLLGQLLRFDLLNADPALPALGLSGPWHYALATMLLLALLAALGLVRLRPAPAFALLWFVLWLVPTNSFFARLDVANDRELYLAVIGAGLALGLLLDGLRRRWPAQAATTSPLPLLAMAVLALVLGSGTVLRNRVYATETAFWQDVLAKAPHNARAANNLGVAEAIACRPEAARAAFERAMQLAPDDTRPRVNRVLLGNGGIPGMAASPECRLHSITAEDRQIENAGKRVR
jgi:protein O-mannosyl-transferase